MLRLFRAGRPLSRPIRRNKNQLSTTNDLIQSKGFPVQQRAGNALFSNSSISGIKFVGSRSFATSAGDKVEEFSFKAETEKLLDIVTHSIYTDKEIFLRELLSNSSDALEKVRFLNLSEADKLVNGGRDLMIKVRADKENKMLVLEDSGIGLSREGMIENLGTIARSGSKKFLENLKDAGDPKNIIGQFGVGFYSLFMVADKVEVISRSSLAEDGHEIYKWSSTGTTSFTLEKLEESAEEAKDLMSTRLILHMREDSLDFLKEEVLEDLIKKRSKFIPFPIHLQDKVVNSTEALWLKQPSEVKQEEYKEFYSSNYPFAFDEPLYTLHFRSDVPIDMKALVFFPTINIESLPMNTGPTTKSVSLFSRKVLLEANSDVLLPNWLRFLKGAVDSDDLPISLSRENVQNSRLVANIKEALTKRVVRMLKKEVKADREKYIGTFYRNFGNFLKEGVCTDFKYMEDLSKLLLFRSSSIDKEEYTSLDEYIGRSPPKQDKIYFLNCNSYEQGITSPYYEVFKKNKVEVIFVYTPLDEFSLQNIKNYRDREIVSISADDIKLPESEETNKEDKEAGEDEKTSEEETKTDSSSLSEDQLNNLKEFLSKELVESVKEVRISTRLEDSPAIITGHESVSTRRLMRQLDAGNSGVSDLMDKQILEVNPKHEIIKAVSEQASKDPVLASLLAKQVFDSALITTGLVDDARTVLPTWNKLLEKLLAKQR